MRSGGDQEEEPETKAATSRISCSDSWSLNDGIGPPPFVAHAVTDALRPQFDALRSAMAGKTLRNCA